MPSFKKPGSGEEINKLGRSVGFFVNCGWESCISRCYDRVETVVMIGGLMAISMHCPLGEPPLK